MTQGDLRCAWFVTHTRTRAHKAKRSRKWNI